jgi:hypothetical protein
LAAAQQAAEAFAKGAIAAARRVGLAYSQRLRQTAQRWPAVMTGAELDELTDADADALRAWLSANHATSPGVWSDSTPSPARTHHVG